MIIRVLPRLAVSLLALSGPVVASALELALPGDAQQTGAQVEAVASYRMPVGPFAGDAVQSRVIEGALDQRAWRFDAPGGSTLSLLQPLRDQLTGAGFEVIYECEAATCGGFDFRYGTAVLPEPEMHVDLGDFRYLAAMRAGPEGPDYVSLIVSRAVDHGFVQITRIGPSPPVPPPVPPRVPPVPTTIVSVPPDVPVVVLGPPVDGKPVPTLGAQGTASGGQPAPDALAPADVGPDMRTLAERLTSGGAQVLADLVFASGSAVLADRDFASLTELAVFLQTNPEARVMLVGHTDASGALAANISLSRERARSVRQMLLGRFNLGARQIEAEGVGYLAPRAPNDTEAGRLANRRVEVILLVAGTD